MGNQEENMTSEIKPVVLTYDIDVTPRQRAAIVEQAGGPVEFQRRDHDRAAWCPACRERLDITEAEMHEANKITCTKCGTVVKDRGADPEPAALPARAR